jgi:hypothetical protein
MRTKGQLAARMILVFLASALTVRCTTTTGALKLHRPKAQVAVTVADIKLPEGTECLVRLISGEDVRGG